MLPIFPKLLATMLKGPYDIGFVEGSVTTHQDAQRIQEIRRQCKTLITIGACATAGGIQALRNWKDVDEFVRVVYRDTAVHQHAEALHADCGTCAG